MRLPSRLAGLVMALSLLLILRLGPWRDDHQVKKDDPLADGDYKIAASLHPGA